MGQLNVSDQMTRQLNIINYIKQLASESMIYGISRTLSKSIGIFLIPVYTRIFSPSDYGIIALITTMTSFLTLFVILGLDNSSGRWYYDSDETLDRKQTISSWFWCQFLFGTGVAILVAISAPSISMLLFDSKKYSLLILLTAITVPLSVFSKVTGNWLRYQRKAWSTTIFTTGTYLTTIGLIILFVIIWRMGLSGIYYARIVAGIITSIFALLILKSWINPAFFSSSRLKEMLNFGLPLIPAAIASWITSSSDRFILNIFHDTMEVGLYSVAAIFATSVALITNAFQLAWGPFAFSILKDENSSFVYSKVLDVYCYTTCIIGTVISLFSSLLIQLLTTSEYFPSASAVPFLVFSHIIIGGVYIVGIGSKVVKRSVPVAQGIFLGALINIGLNFALIPKLGKDGAAIATLISFLCVIIYRYRVSQKDYQIPYRIKNSIVCFLFSWLLITFNYSIALHANFYSWILKVMLCSLFIPLGLWLNIFKLQSIKQLLPNFQNGK